MSFRRSDRETAGQRDQSRAAYATSTEKGSSGLTKPSLFERFKRWFSAKS